MRSRIRRSSQLAPAALLALALTPALVLAPPSLPGGAAAARAADAGAPPAAPIPALAAVDSLVKQPGTGLLELAGPPGATVELSGRELGALPLPGPVPLQTGAHELSARARGYLPFERSLLVKEDGELLRLELRMSLLSRRDAVLYSVLLAGLGQHYLDRPLLGWTFTVLEVGGVLAAIGGELAYTDHRSDYLVLYDSYLGAVGESDVASRRAAADKAWRDMKDAESMRNTGLAVAGGAVLLSVLDAWLRFPAVEAGAGPLPPVRTSALPAGDAGGAAGAAHAGLAFKF